MKKSDTDLPSKADIQAVLRDIGHCSIEDNPKYAAVLEAVETADEELEAHEDSDLVLKRLRKQQENAHKRQYKMRQDLLTDRRRDLNQVWTMLRTQGVTDRVVSEVKKLAEKYLGVKS